MNTNLQNKTFKDSVSLEVQESKQIFNRNVNCSASALISKREISVKTNNSIKQSGVDCGSVQMKDNTPRIQVTVEFAAKQLFQILLVDIKRRNTQLNGELELVPGAISI